MDQTSLLALSVALLALVVVYIASRFRQRIRARINGPGGTGLDVEASSERAPALRGISVKEATSQAGGIEIADKTGRGSELENVQAYGDIRVSSDLPPVNPPPKDGPPR